MTEYQAEVLKNELGDMAAQTLRSWDFKGWLNNQLVASSVIHADETGTNINGTCLPKKF